MVEENVCLKNNNFFSNFIHGFFNNCELPYERRERIEILADNIAELLKEKKQLEIPEIVEKCNVSVIDAISAINILKKKGIVIETEENKTS